MTIPESDQAVFELTAGSKVGPYEIFFVAPDGMMIAVPVESSANSFRPGPAKPLFQTRLAIDSVVANLGGRQYDVTADGQRFLLNQHVADRPEAPITVIVNWPKLLPK